MANKITRTSATTTAIVKVFDNLTQEIIEEPKTITGKWTDENELCKEFKRLTKKDESINVLCVVNGSIVIEETTREMSIEDWLKYSKVVETEK